jgi:isoquinoline 1-oxidoreductase alpha subunit
MINLTVNGEEHRWDGDPSLPLLWYLRDESGLLGTKYGCGQALCGSCTVHVDGQAVRSCITAMEDINGKKVDSSKNLVIFADF